MRRGLMAAIETLEDRFRGLNKPHWAERQPEPAVRKQSFLKAFYF